MVFQNNKEYNLAAAKTYKDAGIVLNGMNLYWQQPTDPVAYERITEESVKLFAPYLDSCEVGNEDNLPVLNGVMDLNTAFQKFKDNVFTPGYNVLSKAKIPYILEMCIRDRLSSSWRCCWPRWCSGCTTRDIC